MKKELVTALYSKLKKEELNVNVLPLLLDKNDKVIEYLLELNSKEFKIYIEDLIKNNNVKKIILSVDELKSGVAYKLSLCTERKIFASFYKRLIDKGVKGDQLIKITNALKKLDDDETLEIILQIVENERIFKSKKIVELIESLSDVVNKNILNDVLNFINNSSKKSNEIINLIIYILSIRGCSTKMLIELAYLIDDYKSAKKIIEIISNSTYGYCAKSAYQFILSCINEIEMSKLIKFVGIISKAKGEDQTQYTRLLLTKFHNIHNITEIASLIANCNMSYQASYAYTVFVENKDKSFNTLLEYVKLVSKSYSKEEAVSLSEILIDEELYKTGYAFELAQNISKLDSSKQMEFATKFAKNKKIIDRGIVFELVEISNKIFNEKTFELIYKIIIKDEVLSSFKTVELADALTQLLNDEIIFVSDIMLNLGMLEDEEFIEMISYLSYENSPKVKVEINKRIYLDQTIDSKTKLELVKTINKIENEIMIESVAYIFVYLEILGYDKACKYLEEISILDSENNKVGTCALQLKIIEELEKNVLKQKTFLEMYQMSPELAIEMLEKSSIANEENIDKNTRVRKKLVKNNCVL